MHVAKLYVVWTALRVYASQQSRRGILLNTVSSSKVMLDIVVSRSGGAAPKINWRLRNLVRTSTAVQNVIELIDNGFVVLQVLLALSG